jgi:hypothetical protein
MKWFKQLCIITLILLSLSIWNVNTFSQTILLEAESFAEKGGWVVDQQSFEVIGSTYLLAHGLGRQVEDAKTEFEIPTTGMYHVFVRTRDWAPHPTGPGKFQVLINEKPLSKIFGADGNSKWGWRKGGTVTLSKGKASIALNDLTGFNGRCDSILMTMDSSFRPPEDQDALNAFRKKALNLTDSPIDAGSYDFVVVGGGMAGTCAALQAARLGIKTALIQNRPVLGGNTSSEVRVHVMGNTNQNLYPKLGAIVRELQSPEQGNANPDPKKYGDDKKLKIVEAQENLSLFLNMHAYQVVMDGNRITAVIARHTSTNKDYQFNAHLFADCTGDGTIGYMAGADYRVGRESREETGESLASEKSDNFTLESSNLWCAHKVDIPTEFPECPWAIQFTDDYHIDATKADWKWGSGFGNMDTIMEAEQIRDHNLRAIFGNWSYLKNHKKRNMPIGNCYGWTYISGKRESRRLLGDHILTQMESMKDACIQTQLRLEPGRSICIFPIKRIQNGFLGRNFLARRSHHRRKPYHIPYRCFYSRNIENLFMAGRNASTTHVAFGSTRVMRTCGMMGEVVGYAASVCRKHDVNPRDVLQKPFG